MYFRKDNKKVSGINLSQVSFEISPKFIITILV